MSTRLFSIFATAAAITAMGTPASADELHLTATEMEQAGEACRSGATLIPVYTDFGVETGEFAIPVVSERSGRANSAIILDQNALDDLPECEAKIDRADLGQEHPQPNTAIS